MNTDIRLDIGYWEHPKTVKLIRRLGLEGPVALQKLWLWATQNRPDGILSDMDDEDIEIVAKWSGEPTALYKALVEVRFIDVVDGTNILHDWAERNPWQAEADDRSDKARFSRLATANRQAFEDLKKAGINAISKEDYENLKIVRRSPDDRPTTVNDSSDETPTPILSFPNQEEKNKSSSPRARVDEPEVTKGEAAKLFKSVQAIFEETWPEAPKTLVATDEMLISLAEYLAQDRSRASPEFWHAVVNRSRSSAFLRREIAGKRGYFPGMKLSWFIKNVGKILNGDFDDAPHPHPRAGPMTTAVDVYSQNQENTEAVLAARRQRRQAKHESADFGSGL